jgi:hypothetical protein
MPPGKIFEELEPRASKTEVTSPAVNIEKHDDKQLEFWV